MTLKQPSEFFFELNEKPFKEFMEEYKIFFDDYWAMIMRVERYFEKGKQPAKQLLHKMRQRSIDLEKLGKQFRERTVEISKTKRR